MLYSQITFLLKVQPTVQISQGVGTFPWSCSLRGTIEILAAATRRDGRLSLCFAQPEQVEAFEGRLYEKAFWELCALVFAVLLQSFCGDGHGKCRVVRGLESC